MQAPAIVVQWFVLRLPIASLEWGVCAACFYGVATAPLGPSVLYEIPVFSKLLDTCV